jgi:threonine dehydrogenase-like Zn-dependent dehydrogenase
MGADVVLDYRAVDVVAEVRRLTGGGADVAIEALGTQQTFESGLRCLRPGGTLSSIGVLPESCRFRTRHSPPASAITASSPRSAPAARNACGV